jgi:hypothetical protein
MTMAAHVPHRRRRRRRGGRPFRRNPYRLGPDFIPGRNYHSLSLMVVVYLVILL